MVDQCLKNFASPLPAQHLRGSTTCTIFSTSDAAMMVEAMLPSDGLLEDREGPSINNESDHHIDSRHTGGLVYSQLDKNDRVFSSDIP